MCCAGSRIHMPVTRVATYMYLSLPYSVYLNFNISSDRDATISNVCGALLLVMGRSGSRSR